MHSDRMNRAQRRAKARNGKAFTERMKLAKLRKHVLLKHRPIVLPTPDALALVAKWKQRQGGRHA